ncbi:hypothetical protein [Bacillus paranthracis]|uniref:hypothetical protein n=1 Tax=Bacillus paranthracis TaxID=2026186 RepID=UPI002FDBEE58|nr:hypothetical protein [Bacillus paranthracis]
MDLYLYEENVTERLIREWKKYGSLVVAYDFDNTVYDYHKEGHSYECVIQLLREAKKLNAYLMVYTARRDSELFFVKEYLEENNIPFDSINETPDFIPFSDEKKLYYNILLDDRAGLPSAYRCLLNAVTYMDSVQKKRRKVIGKEMRSMEYDLKIRQSYHGTGGIEGYRYELYNNNGEKIGRLHSVPIECNCDNTLSINGVCYIISSIYDSQDQNEEKEEVIYYELKRYECNPDFDLGETIK